MVTIKNVLEAQRQLAPIIRPTRLIFSDYFSEFFNKRIYFKPENFQITGSFKARGAYYKLLRVSLQLPKRKVLCVSAGNHAQGVAWACQKLGFDAKVIMPIRTPVVKLEAVKKLGAEILLSGENLDEALLKAKEIMEQGDYHFIHPFNDETIIAGQGTIGLEIFKELPGVGTVIVPIGGGGLIAGISLALKETAKKKKTRNSNIVGVRSYSKIADGIFIKEPGEIPKTLIDRYVDKIVVVEEEEIASAILMLMEKSKLVVEGAGAVGLAALLADKIKNVEEPVVIVLSGGNIDIGLVGKIIRKKTFI